MFDLLYQCFRHFYHLDHANAAVHTASVRYSPITFRLAEELSVLAEGDEVDISFDVRDVLTDLGAYPEDTGR